MSLAHELVEVPVLVVLMIEVCVFQLHLPVMVHDGGEAMMEGQSSVGVQGCELQRPVGCRDEKTLEAIFVCGPRRLKHDACVR